MSLLFVHSPLTGPSALRPLADVAAAGGADVALPDLTVAVDSEQPHQAYIAIASDAARVLPPPIAIVGHSGAGAFLPTIAATISGETVLVLVDAVVPPRVEPFRVSEAMKELLERQTEDGLLRPWLEWWPRDVLAALLPGPAARAALVADMPQVPRSFYDHPVPQPAGWDEQPCGYLQLSAAYDADREQAVARGWPTQRLQATHLAAHTAPADVLVAILNVIDQATSR
jgi:hypothetical protein